MKSRLDLNLYQFLHCLYQVQSLPKVCHELNISRATFNRHLADCRQWLGNELFVVSKGNYQANVFMRQLAEHIQTPLQQLEQAQQVVQSQNLQGAEYVINLINPLSYLLTEPITTQLWQQPSEKSAPVNMRFIDWSLENIEAPQNGHIAVGVSGYPNPFNEQLIERKLGALPVYIYLPIDHALATQDQVELSEVRDAHTVRISLGAYDNHAFYEKIKKAIGIPLTQTLTVATVSAALEACVQHHLLFIGIQVPKYSQPVGVIQKPLMINQQPMQYDVGMHYHRVLYQHPKVVQLEQVVAKLLKQIGQ
ncbi:LysR family transcriptional regulator [Motilimonas pumila]|uniref:LysR family transcriptional regulator n=1 Tax=Motilimonas pumila TaxID=2303987 RepID=A0A418YCP3_9GAMM|nr:LysR family transcriptional regulator [Motilimonas pumila]RJG42273.1 LysR family transcriptional regulator [Motilimonas pumila]